MVQPPEAALRTLRIPTPDPGNRTPRPAEDLRDWLEQPNMDLDGRSPKDWIDAGDYEAVFTTLFLLDPLGPVS